MMSLAGSASVVAGTGRLDFHEDLRALEQRCLGALDIVKSTLDRTLEALDQHDIELAVIVAHDDRAAAGWRANRQEILSLLARQAPVANDLRIVAALLHVIKHAERMGDQCAEIATLLLLLRHEPPEDRELLERICRMGRLARSQVSQAKQAFSLRNAALAEDLARQDKQINRLNREVFARALQFGTDPHRREWAMSMTLIARALERIGDNAVDIGEQVGFVVTGELREFSDASHP
jgi:phosphate transport system protein